MKKLTITMLVLILIMLAGCNSSQVKVKTFNAVDTEKPLDISFEYKPKTLEFKQCVVSGSTPLKVGNLYDNDNQKSYTNQIFLTAEQTPFLKETVK